MAGFDLDTQRSVQNIGLKWNAGTFEFSSGSRTMDVPTTLAKTLGGLCNADLTALGDQQKTLTAYKIGDVSNGAVTFVRAGGFEDEDARMSYLLWGY